MKILACQIHVPAVIDAERKERHLTRVATAISERLSERRADLVVLPELSTIDYSVEAFKRLDELSEPLEGEAFGAFSRLADTHGVFVSLGMPRVDNRGHYISQVTIGPDGRYLGHYDKLHLAQFGISSETGYFTPGGHLHIFEVGAIRVAPIICYDIRFPELCIEHGVDVILNPVAFAKDETFPSWHRFAVCRAMENQVYFLSLNRAGPTYGGSIFCPPGIDSDIREFVFREDETFEYLDIDLDIIGMMRRTFPFRRDRRKDYGAFELLFPPAYGGALREKENTG